MWNGEIPCAVRPPVISSSNERPDCVTVGFNRGSQLLAFGATSRIRSGFTSSP